MIGKRLDCIGGGLEFFCRAAWVAGFLRLLEVVSPGGPGSYRGEVPAGWLVVEGSRRLSIVVLIRLRRGI